MYRCHYYARLLAKQETDIGIPAVSSRAGMKQWLETTKTWQERQILLGVFLLSPLNQKQVITLNWVYWI